MDTPRTTQPPPLPLSPEFRDLIRDVLQAKREELNRGAEALLYEIDRIDKVLSLLAPDLCPNCGSGDDLPHLDAQDCR